MSFPTRSIMENLEELLHSGDCVILNYNTVLKFINPDMNLVCEFQINATEIAEDTANGVGQPHSCAEPLVQNSQFGLSTLDHKDHKSESLHSPVSAVQHASVLNTVLTETPGSNVASGTNPLQKNQQQTVLYCAPGVNLTEGASANYNILQSAPTKTGLYPDLKGNISPALSNDVKSCDEKLSYSDRSLLTERASDSLPTGYVLSNNSSVSSWKCPICYQIAPIVPVSLTHDSDRCKMCGLKSCDEKFSPAFSNDVKSCDEKLSYSDRSLLTERASDSLPTGYVLSNNSSVSSWKCPICYQIAPIAPVSLTHDSERCKMCEQIIQ